jgi:hypothetical protein
MHARGLRLRRVLRVLALAHPPVLPSAMLNDVGTPIAIISQLNTLPALPPVNASMATLRLATHDSGPGWLATPFLYGRVEDWRGVPKVRPSCCSPFPLGVPQ